MTIALLLISDGRDGYLEQTLASAAVMLPPVDHRIQIDDRAHELGFAGAIQSGWEQVLDTGADYVVHLEQDFTFNSPVPLDAMIRLLQRQPQLAQVALKRQPWNAAERAAGGIVELQPDAFNERVDDLAVWTEHRLFWTTNPSVYSTRLCRLRWPQEPRSEGVFTHRLLTDPLLRFAYWGAKHDPPLVHHIGDERQGAGY